MVMELLILLMEPMMFDDVLCGALAHGSHDDALVEPFLL